MKLFDGLDPLITDQIKDLLLEKRKTSSLIIISSHNIGSLEKIVDQYVILSNGRLKENKAKNDYSKTYVKYQMMTDMDLSSFDITSCSLDIVSLAKVGSIYHLVLAKEENIEDKIRALFKPKLLENIPIDSSELIKASMKIDREEKDDVH